MTSTAKVVSIDSSQPLIRWSGKYFYKKTLVNIFFYLNPGEEIKQEDIFYQTTYYHPIFNNMAHKIQERIQDIQGKNNIYYIGSYMGYGFHEDGIKSAYDTCSTLVTKMPW